MAEQRQDDGKAEEERQRSQNQQHRDDQSPRRHRCGVSRNGAERGYHGIGGAGVQTLKQIGNELGITRERVRQIEGRAQEKLRKLARTEELVLLQA